MKLDPLKKKVLKAITNSKKAIPTEYLYDEIGSQLFQEIMKLPEYYPARSEKEIIDTQAHIIFDSLPFRNEAFQIVELGSGDGSKTISLVEQFYNINKDIEYLPIDISRKALETLTDIFQERIPEFKPRCLLGDYCEFLNNLPEDGIPRLFLLLGGNFGNYSSDDGKHLLQKIHALMNKGDMLMLGWDKHKNPKLVQDAYMDSRGITMRFNLNLLVRMNKELGAEFDPNKFDFYASYDLNTYTVHSHLFSLEDQEVWIASAAKGISFMENEPIYTECSRKFTLSQLEETVHEAGFNSEKHLEDSRYYYSISLLSKN
jgi:dimethylhistidine N-methyltransferase